jgi:glycosyltransferase involved in cell wall biosynthesis
MPNSLGVLHVTSWLSRSGGGVPPVIWALARETRHRGFAVAVAGLDDEWVKDDCLPDGFPMVAGEVVGPKAIGFSPKLNQRLLSLVQAPGVVHSHGLWMYPGFAARVCAEKKGCRMVISPHGMLEPWALNRSRWKKKFAGLLFERKNFQTAGCLHALCAAEAENIRRYGLKNPIAVIPNGVYPHEFEQCQTAAIIEKFPDIKDRRRVLFLSRLHSKKGLVNLLEAWRRLTPDFKDWQLLVVGSGEPSFESGLKASSSDLISKKNVLFLGPLYGEEKKQILAAADVFILPSFSEGFSMAILEAAASAVPVLLTPECNFPELIQSGAAIEISTDHTGVEIGIRKMLTLPNDQRKAMGMRGLELVKKSYNWPHIAEQMSQVYQWLGGITSMPETVMHDK